jgi:hypothetical protein
MTKPRRHLFRPPLVPERLRSIGGQGFSFFPNRFLLDGFFAALEHDELLLYFFLVLAGDRNGMSWYHYDKLCSLLGMQVERYLRARNSLIEKDLIAFDGTRFQVLELPAKLPASSAPLRTAEELERDDAATVRALIEDSLRQADTERCRPHSPLERDRDDWDDER